MSAVTERKSRPLDSEITQHVKLGKYQVLNVPHKALSQPDPNGEKIVREASVDLKLARIYQHMKQTETPSVNYSEF